MYACMHVCMYVYMYVCKYAPPPFFRKEETKEETKVFLKKQKCLCLPMCTPAQRSRGVFHLCIYQYMCMYVCKYAPTFLKKQKCLCLPMCTPAQRSRGVFPPVCRPIWP